MGLEDVTTAYVGEIQRKDFMKKTKLNEFSSNRLTLFITTIRGSLVLYMILQAYIMFDMKVTGFVHL